MKQEELQDKRTNQDTGLEEVQDYAVHLRLVFTSDGVVIRRVERYDLMKIKPTESEAEH